jgi:catechol 2,3-dioxygenase-like lactoylglutathione lyase family enzyme
MPVVGIHHVQLAMPRGQEEVARGFYTGVLGIPEVPKPPELAARGGAWFEVGELRVHLGVEADFRPARKAHPGLLVKDLPALVGKLRGAGLSVEEEGPRRAYVHDPFGNRIELMEAP